MHYYLSSYSGDGSAANPFRPPTDVPGWTAIDLRPDCTAAAGRCILALPTRADPPGARYVGDDGDLVLGPVVRTALANELGVSLDALTFRRIVAELLIHHAREDGTRWRPLRPSGVRFAQLEENGPIVQLDNGSGDFQIILGAEMFWSMAGISGGVDVEESFTSPSWSFPTSGLVFRYDFSDATTIWEDSARTNAAEADDVIQGVTDKSGNGNHLYAPSSDGPTWKANIQNGLSVARFDGVSDKLRIDALTLSQPNTIIAVVKFTDADGALYGGAFTQEHLYYSTTNLGPYAGSSTTSTRDPRQNAVQTWTIVWDGSSSRIFIDGMDAGTVNPGTAGFSSSFILGDESTGVAVPFTGDLMEIAGWDHALTSTERVQAEQYLAGKWGHVVSADQSWDEVSGDWQIAANRASLATVGSFSSARLEPALFGEDHRAVCRVYLNTPPASQVSYGGPIARFAAAAETGYMHVVRKNDGGTYETNLQKIVAGSITELSSWSTFGDNPEGKLYGVGVGGSTLVGYVEGRYFYPHSVTDTSIVGNRQVGFCGIIGTGGAANDVDVDDFTARDFSIQSRTPRTLGVRATHVTTAATSTDVMLPNGKRLKNDVLFIFGTIDGTSAATYPGGWTVAENSTWTDIRHAGIFHIVDGTEGWDGTDDSVSITHGSAETAFVALWLRDVDMVLMAEHGFSYTAGGGGVSSTIDYGGLAPYWGTQESVLVADGGADTGDPTVTGYGAGDNLDGLRHNDGTGGSTGVVHDFGTRIRRTMYFEPQYADLSASVRNMAVVWAIPGKPLATVRSTVMATPASSINVMLPNNSHVAVGDLMLLYATRDGGGAFLGGPPTGFTHVMHFYTGLAGDSYARVAYRIIDGTEGWDGTDDSVSFALDSTEEALAQAIRIPASAWHGAGGSDIAGGNHNANLGSTPPVPAFVAAHPWGEKSDTIWLALMAADNPSGSHVTGYPAAFPDAHVVRGAGLIQSVAILRSSKAGVVDLSGSWTLSGSAQWGTQIVAIRGSLAPPIVNTVGGRRGWRA